MTRAPPTAYSMPAHFSFSSCSTFQECPRKWNYRYLAKAEEEFVPAALLFGAAIHGTLQMIHRRRAKQFAVSLADCMQQFVSDWKAASQRRPIRFSKEESAAYLLKQAEVLSNTYLTEHLPVPETIRGIEQSIRCNIAGLPVPLLGRMDMILEQEQERVVLDFKSSRNGMTADKAQQSGVQIALYADSLPQDKPIAGRFIVFRKLKKPRIDCVDTGLEERDRARARHILVETYGLIESAFHSGCFPPRPSWGCKTCTYQQRCTRDLETTLSMTESVEQVVIPSA